MCVIDDANNMQKKQYAPKYRMRNYEVKRS